jgi:uncharacterized protein involved in exopolysaccharide biosynthesis
VLQDYSASQYATPEDAQPGPGLAYSGPGVAYYLQVAKKRMFYFLVPFLVIGSGGIALVANQKPIYLSEGKILVEAQEIPTDLVRSTVAATADQRIQVIQQRLMTRDKLLGVVNKFDLFVARRQWMSTGQLIDLMKLRTQFGQVDLKSPSPFNITNAHAIGFTLSFEYEDPEVAAKVANEFLTLILAEDARTRSSQASDTTRFLESEVTRLQSELSATETKLSDLRRQPRDPEQDVPDQVKLRSRMLVELQADLAQKASIYSDAHPAVQALRRKVAALEKVVASEASATPRGPTVSVDSEIEAVERQVASIDKSLEDANRKLTLARQAEQMEKDQQAERLTVIEQPTVPQWPVKSYRIKLLGVTFAIAAFAGVGAVVAAEVFDKSIRGTHQLSGVIDSHLIVTIPYIETRAETRRNRAKKMLRVAGYAAVVLAGIAALLYFQPPLDVSSLINRAAGEIMTLLSK